jgi:hypothetical protein
VTKIEKEAILMIADISGYTKYMLSNQIDLVHAQVVINELISTIIKQVEIPLEISKLEGDAVFFFAERPSETALWDNTRREIGKKLIKFFEVSPTRSTSFPSPTPACATPAPTSTGSISRS